MGLKIKKLLNSVTLGIIPGLGDDSVAKALQAQNDAMIAAQTAQLDQIKQKNLLDASNTAANIADVTTGDTLTVAENIKKRKQAQGSVSSSLGLV
jgi:hypothetical protein